MGFMKNHFSSLENAYLGKQELLGLIEDYRQGFCH
jgi:hypothetical protein